MPTQSHLKFRLSDLVLLVYLAAVNREFFWGLRSEKLAWVLTVVISIVILATHAIFREAPVASDHQLRYPGKLLAIAYAAPLVFIFLMRLPFPDYNYDVLNYHLVYMERALRGWPFIANDFFPAVVQFNPAADIANGICKYLLGFRLGHILNLAAVLWAASLVERFLRDFIRNNYLRYLGALVVVSTELILFLQSIYLVDLLALPLLVEATLLAVNFKSLNRKHYSLIHIGLFLGISLAFKLTNVAFVIPIAALAVYQAYVHRKELALPLSVVEMCAVIVAPAAPFYVFMFMETGNPVFPLYNRVFQSRYWTADSGPASVFGPRGILQTLLWPFWVYIYPERGSEFLGGDNPYTGRIVLGLVFAIASLLATRFNSSVRMLGLVTAASIFLWSASSGNLRYGVVSEVLSGVVILAVLASLLRKSSDGSQDPQSRKPAVLASAFSLLIAMQVIGSYKEALTLNRLSYSDKVQATIFQDVRGYARESANLFRDRSMGRFLSSDEQQMIEGVDVWVNSYPTTVGIMISLKPEIPIMAVTLFQGPGSFDPLTTAGARERYEAAKKATAGKHLYSLAYEEHLKESLVYLKRAGLRPARVQLWQVPFYSTSMRLKMALIELESAAPDHSTGAAPVKN
ncbi:MAG: hypothetical protein M3R68_05785 [Acidobacteriota bacterium]|nr:hypothetical protein [Acidobacteriota bacterium]